MRVLLYAPAMYPKVDGVALRTRHHVRNLLVRSFALCLIPADRGLVLQSPQELGHQVLILTPIHGASDIFEGAQVVKLPAFVPSGYPESMISYPLPIVTLSRIFNQFAPDIVHFIGPDFIFIPMVLICKYYNVPIIGSYHFYVQAFLERLPAFQRSLLFWLGWCVPKFPCPIADLRARVLGLNTRTTLATASLRRRGPCSRFCTANACAATTCGRRPSTPMSLTRASSRKPCAKSSRGGTRTSRSFSTLAASQRKRAWK